MKRKIILIAIAGLMAIGMNMTSCSSKTDTETIYQCEMHPEVTSDKPGKCPKCGMELEKIKKSEMKKPETPTTPASTDSLKK